VVGRGYDEPDRTGVDVTEDMPADDLVAGAHVAARSAFDAGERLAETWVLAHGRAAVVDEDDVELFRSVDADLQGELDVR
jgi:hypothetical protein